MSGLEHEYTVHDEAREPSPREDAGAPGEVPVVPLEDMEAAMEAGTLEEPAETLGSVLLDAAAPGVEAAVDVVADAATAQSDAAPEEPVEGAIPLSQVPVAHERVNFKLEKVLISEAEAQALVATLPAGSFYKKNPLDPRPGYRVYSKV